MTQTSSRPYVLSIAGFDPSGGAGLLADIKTFEANEVYGLGVCTGLTFQNDIAFERVNWVGLPDILEQCRLLFERFTIDYVKVGLFEHLHLLPPMIDWLKERNPTIKIIWDPILRASAGYEFHRHYAQELLDQIFAGIYLLTPNIPETQLLQPASKPEQGAEMIAQHCPVYLKGGHQIVEKIADETFSSVIDILFNGNERQEFKSERIENGEKHGSGCVLSSAILANLAKGQSLEDACQSGKKYTTQFLGSNPTLLGFHRISG
ncbi:MAG: hydroxymethylpyrimidine/phosphomethylpyrimidine kinase [Bacteroidota bacterium]